MRKFSSFLIAFAASSLAATAAFAGPAMTGQNYSIELNKTQIVRLPMAASAVVIGNPAIADVSVHAADTLFVVGRGFGETNLIVLAPDGSTMMNADIRVSQNNTGNGVHVFNRSARQSYNCSPQCQPSPILGDDPAFINSNVANSPSIQSSEAFAATSSQNFAGGLSSQPNSASSPQRQFTN
ncbi:putative type II/III system pilus formation protein [Litorimonas taeanensis]|uniref:Putative type II/III system pilus formation protein n=1 Tax=Litorimonas taeanensis TaxID=568099 RepID=A0A420WM21_9PROT|nr:pilus assembly protein N-terminal domain-containing protein [Litorimonas taeanensis]RKQ72074.1 putative type II/III system pilus formation protein [Litorimonas taeanensis]